MTQVQQVLLTAFVAGALGLGLLLPRGASSWIARAIGTLLSVVSAGMWFALWLRWDDWLAASTFYLVAGITVLSAGATVTLRNPVYSAIWFAMTLLGTAGIFLILGAQFLGVATIVVYAGAILVTLLFVLMLAQPRGTAYYDRLSWEAWLSATSGALAVALFTLCLTGTFLSAAGESLAPLATPSEQTATVLADQHMAHLGAELFTQHLVAIEVAGTLLLVALVGTVAIVAHSRQSAGSPEAGA